jgi:hypothetical protein
MPMLTVPAVSDEHAYMNLSTCTLLDSAPLRPTCKPRCGTTMALTTLQPLAYAVAYVSFFFGIASTVLRFYSRHYVLKTMGWDDYVAIAVLVRTPSFGVTAFCETFGSPTDYRDADSRRRTAGRATPVSILGLWIVSISINCSET